MFKWVTENCELIMPGVQLANEKFLSDNVVFKLLEKNFQQMMLAVRAGRELFPVDGNRLLHG